MLNRVALLWRQRIPALRRIAVLGNCCVVACALAVLVAPSASAEGDDARADAREKLTRVEARIAKTSEAISSLEKALTSARSVGHDREVKHMSKMLDNMRQQLADLHDAQRELEQQAARPTGAQPNQVAHETERDRLLREIEARRRAAADLERRIAEARGRQERDARRDARTRDRERTARDGMESKLARLERERAERRAKAAERLDAARRKLHDVRRRAEEHRDEREHRDRDRRRADEHHDRGHDHDHVHDHHRDEVRRLHEHLQKLEHHNRELQNRVEQMRHTLSRLEQQVRRQDERIRRSEQAGRESSSTLRRLSSWVKREESRERNDRPHARDARRSDERGNHAPRRGPSVEKQLLDRMQRVEAMLEKLIKITLTSHAKPAPAMGVVLPQRRLPAPPPPAAPKHVRIAKPQPDTPAPPAPVTYHIRSEGGRDRQLRGLAFRGVGPHLRAAPSVDSRPVDRPASRPVDRPASRPVNRPAPEATKRAPQGLWLAHRKDGKPAAEDLSTQLTKVVDRLAQIMQRIEKLEQRIAR